MNRPADLSLWTGRPPVTNGRLEEFVADPIACMRRLHHEHGDIAVFCEDQQQLVFIFSPELNHQVLSDSKTYHSQFFALRGPRHSAQRHLTSGLLTMNGEEHKQQRRLVSGPFEKRAHGFYRAGIETHIENLLNEWQDASVVDIAAEMTVLMRKITSTILFGMDQLDLALEIGEMLDPWIEMNHRLGMAAILPKDDFMPGYEQLLAQGEVLQAKILDLIRWRREAGVLGTDLLSQLIRGHDDGHRVSDEQLVGHVALTFGAAHMTSAHTLAWTLFLLAQHPDVMSELHHELQAGVYDGPLLAFDADKGSLLDRVVKESMRILPASSYSQRINVLPVELGPVSVPRGTPIIFSQFMTHHRADIFPQPDRFHPDRWLTITPTAYEYLPFGAGPRMCLGAALSSYILKMILPRILKRFRLSVVPGSDINGLVVSTMLYPIGRIPMQLSAASDHFASAPVSGNIHSLVELPLAAHLRRAAA